MICFLVRSAEQGNPGSEGKTERMRRQQQAETLLCAGQGWGWDGTGVQQLICALVCSAGQSRLASHSISKLG